jgi:hypothetical protein
MVQKSLDSLRQIGLRITPLLRQNTPIRLRIVFGSKILDRRRVRMTVPLDKLITRAALAKLAGKRSFERGVEYFKDRAVLSLIQAGSSVKARVLGTEEYRVSLRAEGSGLGCSCTARWATRANSASTRWLPGSPGSRGRA